MIHYQQFSFGSPMRCKGDLFVFLCNAHGLNKEGCTKVGHLWTVDQPSQDPPFVLTMVRHPFHWLLDFHSFCEEQKRTFVVFHLEQFFKRTKNEPLLQLALEYQKSKTIQEFIENTLKSKDLISNVFRAYNANSCIRYEDFPWCAQEFLESLGCKQRLVDIDLTKPVENQNAELEQVYKKEILKNEPWLKETFSYW